METTFKSVLTHSSQVLLRMMISCMFAAGIASTASATPDEWLPQVKGDNLTAWNFFAEISEEAYALSEQPSQMVALSCLPEVNISLGQGGYAAITALTLVNAPQYPPHMYEVDIMGPLSDTVYCAQLGQELMVVVHELPTGNSCMSSIFIEDKLKPVLVCTSDTLPCNTNIPTIDFESYIESVTDNCDSDPALWSSYVVQNLPCNPHHFTQQILVTWTATDDSGNSATCQDIIYLRKPALGEIVFPPNISISCVNADTDPSNTGEPTFNGEPLGALCQYSVTKIDNVIPMCPGAQKILRTWIVKDWCTSGQISHVQEILIVDNVPPVITCPVNITINTNLGVCTAKYTLPNPPVTDACANPNQIDIDIFVNGVPGIFSPGQMVTLGLGTTLITIRATDPCGNSSQCFYNVTVRDNTPPVMVCPPNVTIDCTDSTDPSNTGSATATDYCDPSPDITYSDVTTETQGCVGYLITRTWRATDNSGNFIICMQMILITDDTPPTITCPQNVTINCTDSTAPANTGTATATDLCDLSPTIGFTDNTVGGTCPQEYTINRTWSATDDCGNTSTCLQQITIVDNTPPVITCPPNVSIECSSSTDPDSTGFATATDNCDPTPSITFSDINVPSGPQTYTINRTWEATDDCGNSSTCLQLIVVHDETPPVIICPADITIQCTASTLPPNTGMATATDNCDPAPVITYTDVSIGGICPQERTITRTWVATDACGNTASCTQTIVVDDSIAPVITCPANVTIECTANPLPPNTGTATATDNCDGTPTINFTDVTIGGLCLQEYTITRTWSATDDCGNISTCVQTIFVDDSVPPAITCPANLTIQCTDSTLPPGTGEPSATDNCSPDPGFFFTDITIAGACPQELTINRTWIATDDCGNSSTCLQTILVDDSVPPVITCPANITIDCEEGTLPPDTGSATASDNCTGTPLVEFSDNIVLGVCPLLETITRTWTASDGCGNSSTCIQIIVVTDELAPVITCPSDVTIECTASTLPANTGFATATDACDLSPEVTFTDVTLGGNCPAERTITRTWTATDDCGNTSNCTQIIVVDDSTAPVINCPADLTIECDDSTLPVNTGNATASDNCDGTPTVDFSDVTAGIGCPDGYTITRTWVATDDCGNSSSCIQVITIDDNLAPLMSCPDNITVECTASTDPANTGSATATDVCDTDPDITFTDVTVAGSCPQEYTITRTWVATDNCGNSSTCSQTIGVEDTTAPSCATQDITVSLNGSGTITIVGSQVDAGSSDACGPVTLSVVPNTFDCDNLGANVVVLTVTDCPGNSSTCTATVTVVDDGSLEAICQDVTIFIDANGNASVDPADINNGSGGGCQPGDLEFDLSQTDFNCTDLGPNIVILTVTDEDGNTATCTATVTVVDLIPPAITCPPDLTVDCHTITDPENTSQFGFATGTDNCPGTVVTETHQINLSDCGVGTIVRTFTATDLSGNTATCIQTVTVTNPNPLDEGDIDWPPTPVSVDICNSTDPEDIPNGEPVIDPIALLCANPVITFSDQVQTIIDNNPNTPCKIITRTWTVVDNCQPNGTFVFVQTINVQDAVPPLFTNINDMTKVANSNCVAFFTLIASATDCAGVSITNNSPYGQTTGANASGNYPIGVTVVIFTATDGCGNISTMDVVITVTDPNPTTFQCEKTLIFLPPETEIAVPADTFVTFIEGNCTSGEDLFVSFSGTDPYDTVRIYDCGDVGVTTFPLWLWNESGTMILDSCNTADLDLRDPDDFCMDGLVLFGNVENEDGLDVIGVEVSITNESMQPDTTDQRGEYLIGGLSEGTGYNIAPFDDLNHREGVSTLDLVMIQKHLLGKAKLNSPYKIIAADANKSGHLTALDLLEIRKLILGINTRFPNNTSWRFVDSDYSFVDPYNPFEQAFPESIWVDSVTGGVDTADFVGIKIGDVNGSFFQKRSSGSQIKPRTEGAYGISVRQSGNVDEGQPNWNLVANPGQGKIDGMQFCFFVGGLSPDQLGLISSEVLADGDWYYNAETRMITVSWTPVSAVDLTDKVILSIPGREMPLDLVQIFSGHTKPEAYIIGDLEPLTLDVEFSIEESAVAVVNDYHLYQNVPNPFSGQTTIRYSLPKAEVVTLMIHDMTGRQVFSQKVKGNAGINEMVIRNLDLGSAGIYYYTLYTLNASFTHKMSFTND
jgi:hypothetical protein